MRLRWWIAVFLLVALALPLQPGCANRGELGTESSPDEPLDPDDPMEDMDAPGP